MSKLWKRPLGRVAAMLLALTLVVSPLWDYSAMATVSAEGTMAISESNGYEEGAYAEWAPVEGVDGYRAYYSTNGTSWSPIDDELIRGYSNYYRVDAVGLAAGTYYLKVDAVTVDAETSAITVVDSVTTSALTVVNYDRSGYAFSGASTYKTGSGAYNDDGTLPGDAQVLYVTAANAKTVTLDVIVDAKGKTQTFTGLQAILAARQKGYDTTPLDIRIIGCIKAADMDYFGSDSEGLQIKGKNANSEMNITIEGIGEDAAIHGFGILIRNCGNIELRNFAIMDFMDDGVSMDTDNCNIWVHDLDLFYGSTGSDSDQAKGDGSIDIKGKSNYITVSYVHFWDSGKCSLCGMNDTEEFMVTYHHNWFDHSDSRHPRIRVGSIHIYNNYFDGNSKYGVGACKGSSAFVEANYFENCKYPMMSSLQGTDALGDGTFSKEQGGIIKAYDNVVVGASSLIYANSDAGTTTANAVSFDAYLASSRDEQVPNSYATVSGGNVYNNFDTSYDLGVEASDVDAAADVPTIVAAKAGRLNGGDFSWSFDDSENTNYAVISDLKTAVQNYSSSLVSVGGIQGSSINTCTVTFDPNNGIEDVFVEDVVRGQTVAQPADPTIPEGYQRFVGWYNGSTKFNFSSAINNNLTLTAKYATGTDDGEDEGGDVIIHDFTKEGLTSESGFFTISGNLYSKASTSASYNGTVYEGKPLKMESSTSIAFSTTSTSTLVLVFEAGTTKKTNVDGDAYTPVDGVITVENLAAGSHTITKKDSVYLFAIYVIPDGASVNPGGGSETEYTITVDKADGSATTSFTVAVGSAITTTELPTPTREGYSFTGWVDANGKSVVLPYTPTASMTITATWQQNASGGEELDPNALYNLKLNVKNIPGGTYTAPFTKNGFTVMAGAEAEQSVVVEANKKTINGTDYTHRLKLGGVGTKDYRSIKFTAKAAATLEIGCIAATSSETYQMGVATVDANGNFVDLKGSVNINGVATDCSNGSIPVAGDSASYYSLAIPEAGTYYIYGKDGGINFYYLNLLYANGVEMPAYTVNFNAMGGLSVDSQQVYQGEACIEPASTLRSGYTFAGWCSDYECTTEYDFSTPVTGNMTLYAKWTEGETGGYYHVLNMKELPARDYTENFSKNGFTLHATSSKNLSVDISSATVEDNTYPQRLKLNGSGSTTERSISFTTDKETELTVIAASGSAGKARGLTVTNGTTEYSIANIDGAAKYTQTLPVGTWYVYSPNSGVNIYYLSVLGEGEVAPDPDPDDGKEDGDDKGTGDGTDKGTGDGKDDGTIDGNDVGLKVRLANPGQEYVYTGSAIKPAIVVTNNGEKLTAGVDYTVKYTNNVKASANAKITVTGKGNLSGKNSTTFTIKQKDLNDADVKKGAIVVVKNSKATPVLTYNHKKLGTKDYTYANGDKTKKFTENGTITIEGKGNFTGSCTLDVKVVDKLKKFTVTLEDTNLTYDGKGEPKKPTVVVTDKSGEKGMTEGEDYEVFYSDNVVDAGTVKVTVIGQGLYTGTVTKSYKIKPLAVKEEGVMVVDGVDSEGYGFAGKAVTIGHDLTVTCKTTGEVLTEGKDYKISYSSNKKVGTGKYTIKFQGNYKGSKALKSTFTIKPMPLTDEIEGLKIVVGDKVYSGKPGTYVSKPLVSINGVMLKASDYKVTYYKDAGLKDEIKGKNKISLEEGEASKTIYVKLVGKGNYAPSKDTEYATASYELCKKPVYDLSKAKVTFWNGSEKLTKMEYTGNELEPTVKVQCKKNGKGQYVDVPAELYEVSYVNNVNKGTASVVITANGTKLDGEDCAGSKTAKFKIVAMNLSLSDFLKNLFGL